MAVSLTDDKFALKEFFRGVAFTVGLVSVAMLGIVMISGDEVPTKPSSKVVGTYKECDIVRWTNHQLADYKYFLYCGENK